MPVCLKSGIIAKPLYYIRIHNYRFRFVISMWKLCESYCPLYDMLSLCFWVALSELPCENVDNQLSLYLYVCLFSHYTPHCLPYKHDRGYLISICVYLAGKDCHKPSIAHLSNTYYVMFNININPKSRYLERPRVLLTRKRHENGSGVTTP